MAVILATTALSAHAQQGTVILSEPAFPVVDTEPLARAVFDEAFPNARYASADELDAALADKGTQLLVMPYGSAYPETAWPAILRYLERGGNLLSLGGRPFTRAAYQTARGWQLRAPSVAASLELFIAGYQPTPGSTGLDFQANSDVQPAIPPFAWAQAFSPVIRLSVTPLVSAELGSSGSKDAALTTLAWGVRDGHKVAAPVVLIDHLQHRFVGGRWILVLCRPEHAALENAQLLARLGALAVRRGDRFALLPREPLFLPGETLGFKFEPADHAALEAGDQLELQGNTDAGDAGHVRIQVDPDQPIVLPQETALGTGLHRVDATLMRHGLPIWRFHTGFWMRDLERLNTGPLLGAGRDYFTLDGKPMPIVGTTYMSADVDRLYLAEPNPAQWDSDMAQMQADGLNMIRTGMWSGWSQLTQSDRSFTEDGLRAIEAFLLTARRHGLAVQFNLFAFIPSNPEGRNPYLDSTALAAQDRYVGSIAEQFKRVPYLAWDLINEPSPNRNVWKTLPEGDPDEQAAWRAWLIKRYPERAALLAAWSEPALGVGRTLQSNPKAAPLESSEQDPLALPSPQAFQPDGVRGGANPLKVYDYYLFTQSYFNDWAARQRATIRATGSQQLITVGQDEGGTSGRLSPASYLPQVDFTSIHTWWDFDAILWASLAAKLPGKPMLVQEMGEQRRLLQDGELRLTAEDEAKQLERKMALSFVQGAGGIEWVWNVNALMANDNETTIGAVRPDGTEKPEAQVLAGIAKFASEGSASFTRIEAPAVTIVTSQSLLYTGMNDLALAAQKKSLRALCYYNHAPARMLPENLLGELGNPGLVILPSAQALTNTAWQHLLDYVARGGTLLISGPVARNEHWQTVDRMTPLGMEATVMPLAARQSSLRLSPRGPLIQVAYPSSVQVSPLEVLRFKGGANLQEVAHGRGTILWAADPVEFAENYEPASTLYQYAMKRAGIAPAFQELQPLSPGVMAFPTILENAVLYSFSSELLDDTEVDIQDVATKARIHFHLAAQRGALILLRRPDGHVLSSYGVEGVHAGN
jgi:hypothetical protein